MNVSDLEEQIEKAESQGSLPFFVSATSGTSVLGSFDPLTDIAEVCERHRLWFHVDVSQIVTSHYAYLFVAVSVFLDFLVPKGSVMFLLAV